MQEMMDDILKAEEEAERIVKQAKEQVAGLKNALEDEVSEALKKANEEAQKLIHDMTGQARMETEKEFKQAVDKADKENRGFMEKNSEKMDRIVRDIINLIITPEYNRE